MSEYLEKLNKYLFPLISKINNPNILELGVQNGISTLKFLELCNQNNGYLFSVDINDCSNVSKDKKWKFIQSRDDNFLLVKSLIPKEIDIIFIDTLHEAEHVKKIIYNYYSHLKVGGYIFVDDISHLPYIDNKKSSFYCEINNRETFNKLVDIYYFNKNNFQLSFNFFSSGLAIIKKVSNDNLNQSFKVKSRQFSIKNLFRKVWIFFRLNGYKIF